MKIKIALSVFSILIGMIACTGLSRFFQATNQELTSFNTFPAYILEKGKKVEIVEVEITEQLQNTRFSKHSLAVKNGWVTIGIVEGIVSTVDPSPRPSNPMNYLLFEFPGSEGLYSAKDLIEMPVKDGHVRIFVNETYFDRPVYSAVPDGDEYVYGKIKLGVYNHKNYMKIGSLAKVTDFSEKSNTSLGKISNQAKKSTDSFLGETKKFFNVGNRLKESIEKSRSINKQNTEAESNITIISTIRKKEKEHADTYFGFYTKMYGDTVAWLERRFGGQKKERKE